MTEHATFDFEIARYNDRITRYQAIRNNHGKDNLDFSYQSRKSITPSRFKYVGTLLAQVAPGKSSAKP